MTPKPHCQQNTNDELDVVQSHPPGELPLEAAALWMVKFAAAKALTPFVKPARTRKVDAHRETVPGKAARAEKARLAYRAKVEAAGRTVRAINVPDSEEKRAKRRAKDAARKAVSRAKSASHGNS